MTDITITTTSVPDARYGVPKSTRKHRLLVAENGDLLAVFDPNGDQGIVGPKVIPSLVMVAAETAKVRRKAAAAARPTDPEVLRLRAKLNALVPDSSPAETVKRAEAARIARLDVTAPETGAPSPSTIVSIS